MRTLQRRQVVVAAALLWSWLGSACWSQAQERVPAERRLPTGTTVFFSIPDATECQARFLKSSFGQMLQDDAFNPIREDITKWWTERSEEVQEHLGIPPADLLSLLHGELAFAVVQPPGKELGGVLLLDFGEQRATVDALLEKARETLEEQGERSVESLVDTEVTSFLFDDSGEGQGRGSLSYCIRDQYFVLALAGGTASSGILEEVLRRWDGQQDRTFADEDLYRRLMLKCQDGSGVEPQMRWYFSPVDLFRSVASAPQAARGPVSPAMLLGFLPVLGLDKFKAVGGTSTIMTDDFDSVSRTFLAIDQPTSGVLKVFECPATSQQPPDWVPATAAGYSSVNWDIAGAYKAVEALVAFFQPPGTLANMVDQLAQLGPRIHIKEDVVNVLTGRIQTLGELREDVDVEGAAAQPIVVALELANEQRMHDVLNRVAAALDDSLEQRDFRGVKIYEAEIPNLQGGEPQAMGLAVARGQLFFTTDVRLLEGYLRDTGDEPLANSADYRRVASHFPNRTSMISFQRPAAQLKPYYELFRSGQLAAVFPDIDFTKLPEFDRIAHYFNLNGSYAVPADGGALIVQFGLHRD